MRRVHRQVAYKLKSDSLFDGFPVMGTERGWWKNELRVGYLVKGTKRGRKLKECLRWASITQKQWRRFIDIHPEFNTIRKEVRFKALHPESPIGTNIDPIEFLKRFRKNYKVPTYSLSEIRMLRKRSLAG